MKQTFQILSLVLAMSLTWGCASQRKIEERAYQDAMRDAALEQSRQAVNVAPPKPQVQQRKLSDYELWQQKVGAQITSILADTASMRYLSAVSIYDITAGQPIYNYNERVRMRPASTEKMVTAIAVLDLLGPEYMFSTRALTTGNIRNGVLSGDLWIVGTMDPLMSASDMRTLCKAIRDAGVQRVEGSVFVDLGLKDDEKFGWGWCWDDKNPTLTPLMLDGKPNFISALPSQLKAAGIHLNRTAIRQGVLPAAAKELTAFQRPLFQVLEPMMKKSDNLYAESVFYQLASLTGRRSATHSDVARLVNGVIDRAGTQCPSDANVSSYQVQVADGSGLSLYNYQTAETFITLLRYIHTKPKAYQMLCQSLPIAAVDGTLQNRMAGTAAASNLRAKTGSVTGVSTLTGFTTCRTTGHLLAFAILTNGVRTMSLGRSMQDRICIAISE